MFYSSQIKIIFSSGTVTKEENVVTVELWLIFPSWFTKKIPMLDIYPWLLYSLKLFYKLLTTAGLIWQVQTVGPAITLQSRRDTVARVTLESPWTTRIQL